MSEPYKHVLFATNLTDEALPVGRRAVAVAQAMGAQFSMLHVLRQRDVGSGYEASGSIPSSTQEWLDHHRQTLSRLAEHLQVREAEQWVVSSEAVADSIQHAADHHGVDLVVVGNHASHGFPRLWSGSTTEALLHKVGCDLLAVRE